MKIVLRRRKRPQGMRENKMRLVKFLITRNSSLDMNIKLIKHLIKKIKGKSTWIKIQSLKKIFFEFRIFDFFGKIFF